MTLAHCLVQTVPFDVNHGALPNYKAIIQSELAVDVPVSPTLL